MQSMLLQIACSAGPDNDALAFSLPMILFVSLRCGLPLTACPAVWRRCYMQPVTVSRLTIEEKLAQVS